MYGKLFGSMFEGSLYGKGWGPLLVMSYVIAHAVPDKTVGTQVELNPRALADKFGEEEADVKKAIEFLCGPDPDSTSPAEEGRRLVKIGTFSYQVVNGEKYRAIKNEEERREQVRVAMQRHRAKAKANGEVGPIPEGLTTEQQKRADRARRKIAAAEKIDQEVREKFNPDYDPGKAPEKIKLKPGQSLREHIIRQVEKEEEELKNRAPSQPTEEEEDLPSDFQ